MKRIRITKAMLEAHGACSVEVEVFAHTWPKGAVVSLVNLRRAAELGLHLGWFADNFLSGPALRAFDAALAPARQAYDAVRAPARQVFCAARAAVLWKVIQAHGLRGVEPS